MLSLLTINDWTILSLLPSNGWAMLSLLTINDWTTLSLLPSNGWTTLSLLTIHDWTPLSLLTTICFCQLCIICIICCHFVTLCCLTGGGGGCTSVAFVLRMISVVMDNPARSWPYDMIHQFVSRGKVTLTRTYRSVIYSYLSTSCCSLGVAETAFVLHTGLLLYLSEQLPFGGTLMCASGFLLLFIRARIRVS